MGSKEVCGHNHPIDWKEWGTCPECEAESKEGDPWLAILELLNAREAVLGACHDYQGMYLASRAKNAVLELMSHEVKRAEGKTR